MSTEPDASLLSFESGSGYADFTLRADAPPLTHWALSGKQIQPGKGRMTLHLHDDTWTCGTVTVSGAVLNKDSTASSQRAEASWLWDDPEAAPPEWLERELTAYLGRLNTSPGALRPGTYDPESGLYDPGPDTTETREMCPEHPDAAIVGGACAACTVPPDENPEVRVFGIAGQGHLDLGVRGAPPIMVGGSEPPYDRALHPAVARVGFFLTDDGTWEESTATVTGEVRSKSDPRLRRKYAECAYVEPLNPTQGTPPWLRRAVADVLRRMNARPPVEPGEPPAPGPYFTLSVPGRFAAWFEGTGLAAGQDDMDAECRAARLAWKARRTKQHGAVGVSYAVTGNRTVMQVFREYADHCLEANTDERDHKEVAAAKQVIRRVDALLGAGAAD